jgi:integrase
MTDDDISLYRSAVSHADKLTRGEAAKMRGGEALQLSLNIALEEKGIVLHPDDPAWRQLELAFIQARRNAFDGIMARLAGQNIPTPVTPAAGGQTLTEALERWKAGGGHASRKPRANSIFEATRAVQRFVELHGDLPLHIISKTQARQFRDGLAKIPKRLPHALAKLRMPELLKRDLGKYPARNAQTVNKYLNLIAGVMAKAEKDGFFEGVAGWSNPFHVGFEISKMEREAYEPFSVAELNTLFASPVFRDGSRPIGGSGDAAFWFPHIALFTGARRTVAQLKIGDIREAAGIAYIDFNDEGAGQNLKNISSARSVPIHAELLKFGLVEYVARRAGEDIPTTPLWEQFTPPIEAKTKSWSKWFGRYLGEHAVDDPAKTFHSFRHTFKRACREAGMTEEVHNAFTGHSGGGVGRSYGRLRRSDGTMVRGISIERLKCEIDRVAYPGLVLPPPAVLPVPPIDPDLHLFVGQSLAASNSS